MDILEYNTHIFPLGIESFYTLNLFFRQKLLMQNFLILLDYPQLQEFWQFNLILLNFIFI